MDTQVNLLLAGRYLLAEPLGSGGSAAVYRGTDTLLDRPVAVKVFHTYGIGPSTLLRRHTEMLLQARLNHPNLVSIYDARVRNSTVDRATALPAAEDQSYLVMEFVDGINLGQRLARTAITVDECAEIGRAVASALTVVHSHGLIHRDVKPANILLPATGGAKLADFGIARLVNSAHVTVTAEVVGTPLYLSPEQASGGEVGPATDVYSLGLVLLECLTGTPEFPGLPVQSAIARLLRDPQVPGNLPRPWPDLLRAMTSPVPAERPTAEAVTSVLTTFVDHRERSRTSVTISAHPAAHRTDGLVMRRFPAAAPHPTRGMGRVARQRVWELALLLAGFTFALIGVLVAAAGVHPGEPPTVPPSTSSTAPNVVGPSSTTASVTTTADSSPTDVLRAKAGLAVVARVDTITTQTVTAVSTLTQTPTPLSEPPTTAASTTDTVASTPPPSSTTETLSTITPFHTTLPATTTSTDLRTTETTSTGSGTTMPTAGAAVGSASQAGSPTRLSESAP